MDKSPVHAAHQFIQGDLALELRREILVHYYQFNIGDYRRDTPHLSRLEHSIYRDLIDGYYLDENPIPLETQSVMRRLRLITDDEANALKNVLSDFFVKSEDGWHHPRIDADIADYYSTCKKNRENGKKGGRPSKPKPLPDKEENPIGSDSVPTGNPSESQNNPNQEPITNNQLTTPTDVGVVAPPKKSSPKKSSPIPADFYPNETGVRYADERRVSLAIELESFRNWHTAKGTTMKDWQAAWRTWCDKAVEFGRAGSGQRAAPAMTQHQINQAATARAFFGSSADQNQKLIDGEVIQ